MRKSAEKIVWIPVAAVLFLLVLIGGVLAVVFHRQSGKHVLHFGMIAGSCWDVPTGNCYEVVDAAIARFEEKHPGVKVEYVSGIIKEDYMEWLAEQILLGKEPDVFMIPPGELDMLASLGVLRDLEALMKKDFDFQMEDYYAGAYAYGNIRQVQYALPYESVPTLMFVNKTLLEREGIPMPEDNWTWEDFLLLCRRVTKDTDGDGVIDQFGCFDYGWREAVCANGVQLFAKDGASSCFSDARVEAAVKFVRELHRVNEGFTVTSREFDAGKVAFRPFAFSEYRTYKPYPWRIKKYSDFEWDCVKLPVGPDGRGESELSTLLMGMSSRSRQEDMAWELMKELCYAKETQMHLLKASQGMPVIRSAAESPLLYQVLGNDIPGNAHMDVRVIQEVMEEAVEAPNFRWYASAMRLAEGEISQIINGDVSVDSGLLKLQREVNGWIRK